MNFRVLVRGLVLILTLAGIVLLLKSTQLGTSLDKSWVDTTIRGHGIYGELIFLGVAAVFTGLGLPRQVVSFLGGYAFGLTLGSALALGGTVIGCIGAFFYARLLGRELIAAKFPNRVKRVDDFLQETPLTMTLLIRMLPVGSNIAVNLVAGVSSVKPLPFFSGSALGYIPQTVVFALIGSGIAVEPELRISISVILFIMSGILGMHLYRKHRHGKQFDDAIDREIGDINNTSDPKAINEP
jgi:uncharacterized membrane protein YdjX (TVP38/TMEM64 family)